ncbi:hypothetical protein [Runella sp. SP2]|uniref:hypothetical protein n=1 Tax=Runella sp. SP2 TaxID=2268026 RepID=UPI0013DE4A96|nr:hypothetical protein [Runella sp. SP2]
MKRTFVFLQLLGAFWAMSTGASFSQSKLANNTNGIYLTFDDFIHHRLTNGFSNDAKGYHLRIPRMTRMKLTTPDSTYNYSLEDVFGYRENGVDWCYKEGYLLEILGYEATSSLPKEELWLFARHDWSDTGSSQTYFFSKTFHDKLVWFTLKKIRKAYEEDQPFLNLLKMVKKGRLLDNANNTGEPLILDIFSSAHKLHFSSQFLPSHSSGSRQ